MISLEGSSNSCLGPVSLNGGTLKFQSWGAVNDTATIAVSSVSTLCWLGDNDNHADISPYLSLADGATVTFDVGNNTVPLEWEFGNSSTASITKTGEGTLTLSGRNDYTGGTTINEGTLKFSSGSLSTSGNITFSGNSTLTWLSSNSDDISSRVHIDDGVTATFDIDDAYDYVYFDSAFGDYGSGAVVKAGNGTLCFGGDNTYTGGTTISAGELIVGDGSDAGSLGSGNIEDDASLVFYRPDSVTIGSCISGSGNLTQSSGTLILTNNNNSFDGTITIDMDATMQIGDGGTSGSINSSSISDAGTLAFNRSGSDGASFSGVISGIGEIEVFAGTKLTLTGDNTFAGFIIINSDATLAFGQNSLGANNNNTYIDIRDNATLQWWESNNNQNLAGYSLYSDSNSGVITGTFDVGDNDITLATSIGNGFITKAGTGTLTINGDDHDFADVTVNAGELLLTGRNSIGSVTINPEGTLVLAGNNNTLDYVTINADTSDPDAPVLGTLEVSGSLALTNPNSLTNHGTLLVTGAGSILCPGTGAGVFDTYLYGNASTVSDTSVLIGWTGPTGGKNTTYEIEASTSATNNYPIDTVITADDSDTISEAMLSGLTPGTTYYLKMVVQNPDGSQDIYDGGMVQTDSKTDVDRLYQLNSLTDDDDDTTLPPASDSSAYMSVPKQVSLGSQPGSQTAQLTYFGSTVPTLAGVAPKFKMDNSWVSASSFQEAAQQSLLGLVTDGTVPTVDPLTGNFMVYQYTYPEEDNAVYYTFDAGKAPSAGMPQ